MTTWLATVDADHKIEAPAAIPAGQRVIVAPVPDFEAVLSDPERAADFAAVREAIRAAMNDERYTSTPTNEEIVALVKKARRSYRENQASES